MPISAVEIADYARMNEQAARNALKKMAETGYVRVYGRANRLFTLRDGDPVVESLAELFRTERRQFTQITDELRGILTDASLRPGVAWIRSSDQERRLELCYVSSSDRVAGIRTRLQTRVAGIEQKHDLTIEIRGFSRADEPEIDVESIIFLEPSAPVNEGTGESRSSHAEQEARSAARSRRIAAMVESVPDLIPRALDRVEELLATSQGAADADLAEWRTVLREYSVIQIRQLLTSSSPRAKRLRQSSPFTAVLTPGERSRVNQSVGFQ